MAAPQVAIIIHSIRNPSVGPRVAEYVKSIIDQREPPIAIDYVLVDVKDFNLPIFNEMLPPAAIPMMGSHQHETTKRWSAEISKYAGYIFVTPEYNFGMPGPTKNAIDYLYNEWTGKPGLVVSYGVQGGKLSGDQLKGVLDKMKLQICETRPALPFLGGQGPDGLAAMTEGKLGDDTRNSWDKEYKSVIEEGLKELEGKLAVSQKDVKAH